MRLTCTVRLKTGSNMAAYLSASSSSINEATVMVNLNDPGLKKKVISFVKEVRAGDKGGGGELR